MYYGSTGLFALSHTLCTSRALLLSRSIFACRRWHGIHVELRPFGWWMCMRICLLLARYATVHSKQYMHAHMFDTHSIHFQCSTRESLCRCQCTRPPTMPSVASQPGHSQPRRHTKRTNVIARLIVEPTKSRLPCPHANKNTNKKNSRVYSI